MAGKSTARGGAGNQVAVSALVLSRKRIAGIGQRDEQPPVERVSVGLIEGNRLGRGGHKLRKPIAGCRKLRDWRRGVGRLRLGQG